MALVTPAEFLWREWRLGERRFAGLGPKSSPRPSVLPKLIPPMWWARLAAFLLKRKLRREEQLLAFWRGKPAFGTAWTNRTPEEVCAHVKALGGRAVWVQNIEKQRARAAEWRAAATAAGLDLVVWEWGTTVDSAIEAIQLFRPDGFVVNVEHDPGQWDRYCDSLRVAFPNLPLAVWTNFWGAGASHDGYDKSHSAPFIRNRFMCVTEAYMVNEQGPQPTLNPDMLDWTAKAQLGYPETIPSYGIYRCGPEVYDRYMSAYPGYVWYLYEYYPGGA